MREKPANKMKTQNQILTNSLRNTLKEVIQTEIQKLPELLEKLPPSEHLNVLCKLTPFVFPKVEAVNSSEGEPFSF
jgi:hypothetical protein